MTYISCFMNLNEYVAGVKNGIPVPTMEGKECHYLSAACAPFSKEKQAETENTKSTVQ